MHTAAVTGDVDGFVAALREDWQRRARMRLLEEIRAAAPFGEHIKWRHPYFDLEGAAVLKWFCAKDWINVYFFRGRELRDPHGLFQPSDNSKMLTVKVTQATDLDSVAFRELVRAAAALARVERPRRESVGYRKRIRYWDE